MLDHVMLISLLGLFVVVTPLVLVCVLGLSSLFGRPLGEETTGQVCRATMVTGLLAAAGIPARMLAPGTRHGVIDLRNWVVIPDYHFSVKLVFDRLSVPFAILTFLLCGTVAVFSGRYMHRERGYNRFFVLFSLFVVGMVLTAVAGTIE